MTLVDQYRVMHANPKRFRGLGTCKYADAIASLVEITDAHTVLDYGAGKGLQYQSPYRLHEFWGVDVRCYDPAVARFAVLPVKRFDGVVCCDVLEHLEPQFVIPVLTEICEHARRFVFLAIGTKPARKSLPDGRNCHLSIHPLSWWEHRLVPARERLLVKIVEA